MAKPALGRGLGALLGGGNPSAQPLVPGSPEASLGPASANDAPLSGGVRRMGIGEIRPCPLQPRKDFPDESLRELADSIRQSGIVQPLIVRSRDGHFELIAGERRWRAAQIAGVEEVPVVVREADDREVLELALIENLQRENLNAIEEGQGYAQLVGQFKLRQEDVAARVGKSRAAVANALRLLNLPAGVQRSLCEGRLSPGHGKALLSVPTPEGQTRLANRVIAEGLNVRQTEALASQMAAPRAVRSGPSEASGGRGGAADAQARRIEEQVQERLGTRVRLRYRAGKGSLEIQFFSDSDLERVLHILGVTPI